MDLKTSLDRNEIRASVGITWCVTGHRPDKLGGYGADVRDKLLRFALKQVDAINPDRILTGMALGWDQAIAQACALRKIPFAAYVPCDGQEKVWPDDAQERYRALIDRAATVFIVAPGRYAPEKMQRRNECMVGDSESVLALWDGSAGGTANCLTYARRANRAIVNVWDEWRRYS